MKTKTVELSEPAKLVGGAEVRQVVLRMPIARDLFDLGEPAVITQTKQGMAVLVNNYGAIRDYLERLVIEPSEPDFVETLPLRDAVKLRDAVLDFFGDARDSGSTSPPAQSSSDDG